MKKNIFKKYLSLFLMMCLLLPVVSISATHRDDLLFDTSVRATLYDVLAGVADPMELYDTAAWALVNPVQTASTSAVTATQMFEDADYYLNSSYSGSYLKYESPDAVGASGFLSVLGNSIQWRFKYVGDGYTLCAVSDTTKYLAVPEDTTSSLVEFVAVSGSDIPDRCIWNISIASGGGCLVKNVYSSKYLYTYGSSILASSTTGTAGTSQYKTRVWRIPSTTYYGNTSAHSHRELQSNFSINTLVLTIGESASPTINKYPSNSLWAEASDFDYTTTNGNVTINNTTNKISVSQVGTYTVTATHKVTGLSKNFTVEGCKKAIIILPGIMGSQIFADGEITIPSSGGADLSNTFSDGERLWAPSIADNLLIDEKILALKQNANGTPVYSTTVNAPIINQYNKTTNDFQYGTTDIYRALYNSLYESYYSVGYDIILYEFDWRKDPYDTAELLNTFINNNHYADIIFVSHSMGGIVSSYYLSLGQAQRERVDKHISVGTPYLGSVEMPYMYLTGNIRDTVYENWIISDAITEIIYNIPSIYALFPFEQNWQSYLSYRSSPTETVECETYSETMSILSSKMPNWNSVMASQVCANKTNLFCDNGAHITTLVHSYYIVGSGEETSYATCGLPENLTYETSFASFTLSKSTSGDGTVSVYSATAGGSLSSSRIFYKTGNNTMSATHIGMISGENSDFSTINFIKVIIDEAISDYSDSQLSTQFGISQ